jgi:biotin carboxyl carrier protein
MPMIRLRPAGNADAEAIELSLDRTDREPGVSHVARIGESRYEAELEYLGRGEGWMRLREKIYPFFCHRDGDRVQVWLAGKVHEVEIVPDTPQRANATAGGPRSANLAAPMPGAVLKVIVEPGDEFEAHQPLVIMESMKMELTLSVPHPGKVSKVNCEVGELVELGAVLVELSAATPEEDAADEPA